MIIDRSLIKEKHLEHIKKEWLNSASSFPDFLTTIPDVTKTANEEYLQSVSDKIYAQLNSIPKGLFGRKKWKTNTFEIMNKMLSEENIIGVHNCMDSQTLDLFQSELREFMRHARTFSPESSLFDLGQAVRNYTVYAMFAELFHQSHEFNLAAFGYSMLYPFTDNYIDSEDNSETDKQEYNQMIEDKIKGNEVHPTTLHHKKTCELLDAIESRYPRVSYGNKQFNAYNSEDIFTGNIRNSDICDERNNIYSLLLMMLEAQKLSLAQQHSDSASISQNGNISLKQTAAPALTSYEVLDISLYKGGVSVLIDGFFVNDELTDEDLHFYLGFGFFLQLADDLQDIAEDSANGSLTLFTYTSGKEHVEMLINQLLHFVHGIMDSYSVPNDDFKKFVFSNCCQLIYSSASGSREFISKEYLDRLEEYLPVSYAFLEKTKNSLPENQNLNSQANYMKILDELLK